MALVALLGAAAPSSLLDRLWSLFSSFWSSTALKSEEGIGWDPYGSNNPPQKPQGDEGIGWDPDGAK
jgi:hypothetical protein